MCIQGGLRLKHHRWQISCFLDISLRHLTKILNLSQFAKPQKHDFLRRFILEAFGEDVGAYKVS
jgi:hypothetical protein